MSNDAATLLYVTQLATAVSAGIPLLFPRVPSGWRAGVPAALGVGIALVSAVQLAAFPSLLTHLERNRRAIEDGQVWRIATSLFVQDSGWQGFTLNMTAYLLIGAMTCLLWPRRQWLVIVCGGGLGAQLIGLFVQPVGGGNSVINFGLAASVAVLALLRGDVRARLFGALCVIASLALVAIGNIHGWAAVLGGVAALLCAQRVPHRSPSS